MRKRPSVAALYAELNARFWAGQLPPALPAGFIGGQTPGVQVRRVPVAATMTKAGRPQGLRAGRFDRRRGMCVGLFIPPGIFAARIRVLSPLTDEHERQVLLHEMCHYAVFLAGDEGAAGHGPRFVAELRRLVAQGERWAHDQAERYRREPTAPRECGES